MYFRVGVSCHIFIILLVINMLVIADLLPRLRKGELICLLSFTRIWFLFGEVPFPLSAWMCCIILLWQSPAIYIIIL